MSEATTVTGSAIVRLAFTGQTGRPANSRYYGFTSRTGPRKLALTTLASTAAPTLPGQAYAPIHGHRMRSEEYRK